MPIKNVILSVLKGFTTFSKKTLSLMVISVLIKNETLNTMTPNITTLSIMTLDDYECHYAYCHSYSVTIRPIQFVIRQSAIKQSVITSVN